MFKSVMNLKAPKSHVFGILSDYRTYREWMPGCVQSEVLSEEGNAADVTFTIQAMKTMTMGLKFEAQPDQYVGYRMTKGQDLKSYEGSWRLMDAADGGGTVRNGYGCRLHGSEVHDHQNGEEGHSGNQRGPGAPGG